MKRIVLLTLCVAIVVGGCIVLFTPAFERKPPQFVLPPEGTYLGAKATIEIGLRDKPAGLKEVSVSLLQRGKVWKLLTESFPPGVKEKVISLSVEPKKLGLREGKAYLVVEARDRSLWMFGRGNRAYAQVEVQVDFTPPWVELLASTRYVYFNGAAAALFRTSHDAVKAGVRVGDLFFKAYPKEQRDGFLWAVLFGIPQYAGAKEPLLVAQDRAGNSRVIPVPVRLLPRKVVEERVSLSDRFLRQRVYPLLPAEKADVPPEEAFKFVNEEMRAKDEAFLTEVASRSGPQPLWQGPFIQMPNSKVTATFGDKRTYFYKGKFIGRSIHLGYDLASVANAPIPAANRGRVIFTGFVGIYGNVVILDHGLGLTSLYAHLSRWTVEEGEEVEKGQVIGYTDSTGLAGGDHLHYAVLLSGHPVNPVEWWDGKWLRERIIAVINPFLMEDDLEGN